LFQDFFEETEGLRRAERSEIRNFAILVGKAFPYFLMRL